MTMNSNSLLTDEQEKKLAIRIQNGDDNAINELVSANLNFVAHIAKSYVGQGVDFDDLVSEGNIGMIKAAAHFKPDFGHRFVSFAAPSIRQEMEKAIRQQAGLYNVPQNGRAENDAQRGRVVSVEAPIPAGSQNNYNLLHIVENKNAHWADDNLMMTDGLQFVGGMLDMLDNRERQVISYVYGIGTDKHTMAETGDLMNLKRERVRQIRDKALRKLRKNKNTFRNLE